MCSVERRCGVEDSEVSRLQSPDPRGFACDLEEKYENCCLATVTFAKFVGGVSEHRSELLFLQRVKRAPELRSSSAPYHVIELCFAS